MSNVHHFFGHTIMKSKGILDIEKLLQEVGYEFEKSYTLINLDKKDRRYPDNYRAKFKFTRPDGAKVKYKYVHPPGELTYDDQKKFISWVLTLYYFELALCEIEVPPVDQP